MKSIESRGPKAATFLLKLTFGGLIYLYATRYIQIHAECMYTAIQISAHTQGHVNIMHIYTFSRTPPPHGIWRPVKASSSRPPRCRCPPLRGEGRPRTKPPTTGPLLPFELMELEGPTPKFRGALLAADKETRIMTRFRLCNPSL